MSEGTDAGPPGGRSGSVLLTGGAGYVGSHVAVELLAAGFDVAVLDDLSNSSTSAVERASSLGGGRIDLHVGDVRDEATVDAVLAATGAESVVHLAGLKAVAESVEDPLRYYDVNVGGALTLLRAMDRRRVRRIVFSSSATVYGEPERVPLTEGAPLGPVNPYGRTKLAVEDLLRDLSTGGAWSAVILRYFNPVGAHPSGRIGEDPRGTPNNLLPVVLQVAVGRRAEVQVFGGDYPTPDGTCIRDYIHVVDLARGHVAALSILEGLGGCRTLNLGTGNGHSVLEVIAAASAAAGRPIPSTIVGRRPGDVTATFADPTAARSLLGWSAQLDLAAVCRDSWRWQSANPDGYR